MGLAALNKNRWCKSAHKIAFSALDSLAFHSLKVTECQGGLPLVDGATFA